MGKDVSLKELENYLLESMEGLVNTPFNLIAEESKGSQIENLLTIRYLWTHLNRKIGELNDEVNAELDQFGMKAAMLYGVPHPRLRQFSINHPEKAREITTIGLAKRSCIKSGISVKESDKPLFTPTTLVYRDPGKIYASPLSSKPFTLSRIFNQAGIFSWANDGKGLTYSEESIGRMLSALASSELQVAPISIGRSFPPKITNKAAMGWMLDSGLSGSEEELKLKTAYLGAVQNCYRKSFERSPMR